MAKKMLLTALMTLASTQAFAVEKYCGVVAIQGVKSFVYAEVIDGQTNPAITGDTADPFQIVKVMKNQNCYCVEGSTVITGEFMDFSVVTGIYQCNGGPKIAPK